jgi:hypothetical protein
MNREFTIAITTSWQNVGNLLRQDGDFTNGRGLFEKFLMFNEGTGVVSIKGTGNRYSEPTTDGGIKLSATSGNTPSFLWEEGFDADRTWIKATIAGNVSISAVPSELA